MAATSIAVLPPIAASTWPDERGRAGDPADAAPERGCREADDVRHGAAADGEDAVAPLEARLGEGAPEALEAGGGLLALTPLEHEIGGHVVGDRAVDDAEEASVAVGERERSRARPDLLRDGRGHRGSRHASVDDRIGGVAIVGAALLPQPIEARAIGRQRPGGVDGARPRGRPVDVEPHHQRALTQQRARRGIPERAAAERDDGCVRARQERRGDRGLARAEGRLALLRELLGDPRARLVLHLAIEIGVRASQTPGEGPPDGRLAGAHEAGEHDRPGSQAGCHGMRAR